MIVPTMFSEVGNRLFKKVTQSIVILPHFISWTVIALLCEALLTILRVWQGAGYGSIVYLATIAGLVATYLLITKTLGIQNTFCKKA